MRFSILACALLAFAAVSTSGAQAVKLGPMDGAALKPTDIERVSVGTHAPDFALAKYGGGTVTLSELRGKKNVVLVFFRGYWCPYCITQLTELRSLLDAELKSSAELVVVSIDGDNETRQTATKISRDGVQADFTFLSDPTSSVISRYGILNPSGSRKGLPHPATYVIDKAGVVRWRVVEVDYKVRPSNEDILKALRALPR
jgi:peroxiredoxin